MNPTELTGAVLAGGQSRRFGQSKALFEFGGQPLLYHVLNALEAVCAERLVVARTEAPLPPMPPEARLIFDEFTPQHPLSGILTALRQASHPWVFVCAVDMPFLQPALIRWMFETYRDGSEEVIVPEYEGRLQPLHALYRRDAYKKLLPFLQGAPMPSLQVILRAPTLKARFLPPAEWERLDPRGESFGNLNRPPSTSQ